MVVYDCSPCKLLLLLMYTLFVITLYSHLLYVQSRFDVIPINFTIYRSLAACEQLYNAGYKNLFWVQGGLEAAEEEVAGTENSGKFVSVYHFSNKGGS